MSIWTKKDGKKIEISKMTDSHLLNSIDMLNRQEGKVINMVTNGMKNMGEAAGDMIAEDAASLPYGLLNPHYADLVNEAIKRKLMK